IDQNPLIEKVGVHEQNVLAVGQRGRSRRQRDHCTQFVIRVDDPSNKTTETCAGKFKPYILLAVANDEDQLFKTSRPQDFDMALKQRLLVEAQQDLRWKVGFAV